MKLTTMTSKDKVDNYEDGEIEPFVRICDCNNGRYIATITKREIEYIHNIITKHNVDSGDWITYAIAENAIRVISYLNEYLSRSGG